ncbi:unnamed protein product [Clonostachys byssicola]|uniref:NACHT-NTPase and P-loop NTPases N-terminal domain-containing protein n=1 Tax=Clonostachys byssicola TaxID=160290 RepID=A0A9N9US20_9HYPO|nr:unnamed protein product [Clonostachys byssicola]
MSDVFGLLGTTITSFDIILTLRQRYMEAKEVPGAFPEVLQRMEIARRTLQKVQDKASNGIPSDDDGVTLQLVQACKEKTDKLEVIFDKAAPVEGASPIKKYRRILEHMKNSEKVEDLAKSIFRDLQILTQRWSMDAVTQSELKEALEKLEQVEPSIRDSASTVYGSGVILHNYSTVRPVPDIPSPLASTVDII